MPSLYPLAISCRSLSLLCGTHFVLAIEVLWTHIVFWWPVSPYFVFMLSSFFTFLEAWVFSYTQAQHFTVMCCMTELVLPALNTILSTLVYVVKIIMTLVSQLIKVGLALTAYT